jgi:thiopeptide-type bacteriocin biosynthesis protein
MLEKSNVVKTSRWLSFHVFVCGSVDEFLVHHFLPYLETSRSDIKRFFFIRHSEGGMHLRLRFLPRLLNADRRIATTLNCLVENFSRRQDAAQSSPGMVQETPYDRSLLYFGDNLGSVYAELLNEQTSYLALHILPAHNRDPRYRFLLIVSALLAMYRLANKQFLAVLSAVKESLAFVRNAITGVGLITPAIASLPAALISRLERQVPPISKQLQADLTVQRIGRLLRRARQLSAPAGVGTHALHLFCNKLGFPLPEEYKVLVALETLLERPWGRKLFD